MKLSEEMKAIYDSALTEEQKFEEKVSRYKIELIERFKDISRQRENKCRIQTYLDRIDINKTVFPYELPMNRIITWLKEEGFKVQVYRYEQKNYSA